MGRVAAATALPDRVDVVLQVNDDSVVVPMRSTAVLHQYGLMAPATHIELRPPADLLPQTVEAAKTSNPHSAACTAQGAIVCHNGRLAGQQGGSVDEVTRITVKRMRAKSRDA